MGVVSSSVTTDVADWYNQFCSLHGFNLCSHTHEHFRNPQQITNEEQVVKTNKTITLNKPYRVSDLVLKDSSDNTFVVTTSNNPGVLQYKVINSILGIYKFNPSVVGQTIYASYKHSDSNLNSLQSMSKLNEEGCLTSKSLYTTGGGDSIAPSHLKALYDNDVVVCSHEQFPARLHQKTLDLAFPKAPYGFGYVRSMFSEGDLLTNTRAFCEETIVPNAIAKSIEDDTPLVGYIHDFPYSEYHPSGILSDPRWITWKISEDINEIRDNYADFWTWVVQQFDNAGVAWMTRGDYCRRYYYLNRHLSYDVELKSNKIMVTLQNTGEKRIEGLTIRVPLGSAPKSVKLFKQENSLPSAYESGILTTYLDLAPGSFAVLEVTQ
jgi:hypothetical protein